MLTLREAVSNLEKVENIYEYLKQNNYKGVIACASACILANYFTHMTRERTLVDGTYFLQKDTKNDTYPYCFEVVIESSEKLCKFQRDFDDGKYPDLISKE